MVLRLGPFSIRSGCSARSQAALSCMVRINNMSWLISSGCSFIANLLSSMIATDGWTGLRASLLWCYGATDHMGCGEEDSWRPDGQISESILSCRVWTDAPGGLC